MKRIATIAVVAAALSLSSTASAKDMSGRMGIGADSSLSVFNPGSSPSSSPTTIPGISIVYQSSRVFGIQAILAYARVSQTVGDEDLSASDTVLALRAIYSLLHTSNTSVGVVGGIAIDRQSQSFAGMSDSVTHLAFEVGVRPEWFVSDWFSIHTQVGVSFTSFSESNDGADDGGSHMSVFGSADLLGSAGFTFYF